MQHLFSSVVQVEIEGGLGNGEYTVLLPHCFNLEGEEDLTEEEILRRETFKGTSQEAIMPSKPRAGPLAKESMVVVMGDADSASWSEVLPECFELVPPETNYGVPAVRVTLHDSAIVAVYSRKGCSVGQVRHTPRTRACACPRREPPSHPNRAQVCQMMAFVPSRIIPLERDILRIYCTPFLPSSVQEVNHAENVTRGHVVLAGTSETFLAFHDRSIIEVSVDQGDGLEKERSTYTVRTPPLRTSPLRTALRSSARLHTLARPRTITISQGRGVI